ncbi:MAG TPA: 3-hydroxyacyl-CoA dehydrogenase NAD-binding domain-containing protein [Polyangiaceae bacterium]|nr:3-hydroxyacyl-CoA dehydrogenase NAD-binding domain-containing protein [Polyangiaceae bacterium]
MPEIVTITRQGRVGVVALNNPPVNALSHALRKELCARLADALATPEIEAIVLWCEGRTFVAGADIREFGREPQSPDVPEAVEFVDGVGKPVIAALHGTTLGGGLELALACHFRVAAPATKLGFPEVSLGILPGAGGTQRLPRLVGVRAALELIVGGAPVNAARAQELGLVDALIPGDLKAGAIAFAERVIDQKQPPRKASALTATLDSPTLFEEFEAGLRDRFRGQLAPFHCVQAVRAAVELPFPEGLKAERRLFAELMSSAQAKAQRHVFFAEREVAKVPGLANDTPTRPVKSAAVVGAGSLGTMVAICFADAHLPVSLVEFSHERLDRSLGSMREHYAQAVAAGRLDAAEMEARLRCVRPTLDDDELGLADLVVEAVFEDLELKRQVFAKLDASCKPGAILATTTSHLDVEAIARATKRPEDVLGMHFPSPIPSIRLVEIARTRRTAPDVWASALSLCRSLGRLPVPVFARPGFVGQRMLSQELREGLFLLEEGALPEQVDRVCYDFGFPLGPFAAADRDGLDVIGLYRNLDFERFSERERACDILDQVCERDRFGRRTGAGFYRYAHDGTRTSDPEITKLIVEHSEACGINRRTITDEEILERCLYAMINEGARILDEGVAARPLDVDMIWIHGYGFPTHRGGPMFYADQLGLSRVHRAILDFQNQVDPVSWAASPLLTRLSKNGSGFYGTP